MIRVLGLLLWMACSLVGAAELLSPEQAFKPTVRALDGQTIEVQFKIAKGYYLYRDKFRFSVESEAVKLGPAVFPKGQEKKDETFGLVEAYYREVTIRLPVERNSSGELPLALRVSSQGCADIGICYPPQQQMLRVQLPAPSPPHKHYAACAIRQ